MRCMGWRRLWTPEGQEDAHEDAVRALIENISPDFVAQERRSLAKLVHE